MLHLILPWGKNFGWGICGKHLVKELAQLAPVKFLTVNLDRSGGDNELEFRFFEDLRVAGAAVEALRQQPLAGPVLQGIGDHHLAPYHGAFAAPRKVGYTFFESLLPEGAVARANDYFDVVVGGSSWCSAILQEKGVRRVATVIQGVDPLTFNPSFAAKELFRDRFLVFSGGKFEFRKAQDIVLRAFKVLQDRYDDVLLVNSWYNHWSFSMDTMAISPLIRFRPRTGDYATIMTETLAENGLDLQRVITLPVCNNETMARIYQNTDVGLFPNRCEGGTNLVLMEYMACGKPVIASFSSGHRDILRKENALLIETMRQVTLVRNEQPFAIWDDPNLDETVAHLEWAYHHRDELRAYGQRGAADLAQLTWKASAQQFYRLLTE